MTNFDNEKIVNYLVVLNRKGRSFTAENDTRWGGLLEPDPEENQEKTKDGLRVVLFASWDFGYIVLETLKEFERKNPHLLNLVGLVTDDPLNPDAKISMKKRVWSLLDLPYRVIDETFIVESALSSGVPVYTGEIKVESFHDILKKWNPDAILVCVFGQVIDSLMINLPAYGIYNFHPSDLNLNLGAGPAPYEDLARRKAETTVWSVHHVSETIDGGTVIGQSPPVKVLDVKGELPSNPLLVYQKLAEALSPLVFFLINELERNYQGNKPGRINNIDFNSIFPDQIKSRLMQSVTRELWNDVLSIPEDLLFDPGEYIQ